MADLTVVKDSLLAPAHAHEANERRQRTLVPCVYVKPLAEPAPKLGWMQTLSSKEHEVQVLLQPEELKFPKAPSCMDDIPKRWCALHMHVMVKDGDKPLCRREPPSDWPILKPLTPKENNELMAEQQRAWPWDKIWWCNFCTTYAALLIGR